MTSSTDDAVVAAVIDAYYPDAVRAGAAARGRAQAAQSASSLGSAVLVGLFIQQTEGQPWPVLLAATLTIGAFGLAAVLFAAAVGAPIRVAQQEGASDGHELVRAVMGLAKQERDRVDSWQRRASISLGLGLVGALVVFVLSSALQPPAVPAVYTPTEAQRAAIAEFCGGPRAALRGQAAAESWSDGRFVRFEAGGDQCRGQQLQLRVDTTAADSGLVLDAR